MIADLVARLGARFGLQPLPSWERDLAQTLERLCIERNTTLEDVANRADTDPTILRELAAAMTVGESYFLRDARQFDAALNHIVARAQQPAFSVWSAGCSSGEEPYSLAILLVRYAPHLASRIHIRASDMNSVSLERAGRGVYSAWSFRSVPPWLPSDFFVKIGKNEWVLAPAIRNRVKFHEESIQAGLARTPPSSVDVIFFRNVSIYAQREALQNIFNGFHRVLKDDGLLVQSVSDACPPPDLFAAIDGPVLGLFSPMGKTVSPPKAPSVPPARATERRIATTNSKDHDPERAVARSAPPPPVKGSDDASATATTTSVLQAALEHADKGQLERAFECVDQVLSSAPENVEAHFIRGKLLMAERKSTEAVAELRQVIFLSPGHRLGRYWLATALIAIDLPRKAMLELTELGRRLVRAEPAELLEDGKTNVAELATAVDTLQRTLQ